jgi:hypothetical protein
LAKDGRYLSDNIPGMFGYGYIQEEDICLAIFQGCLAKDAYRRQIFVRQCFRDVWLGMHTGEGYLSDQVPGMFG